MSILKGRFEIVKGCVMAIEIRGNSGYYYRSRRNGKKVTRKYIAVGEDARLAAAIDGHRPLAKQMQQKAFQACWAGWDAACESLDELFALTGLLLRATLLAQGYRQHHQGEWRRRHAKR